MDLDTYRRHDRLHRPQACICYANCTRAGLAPLFFLLPRVLFHSLHPRALLCYMSAGQARLTAERLSSISGMGLCAVYAATRADQATRNPNALADSKVRSLFLKISLVLPVSFTMSQAPTPTISTSNYQVIFDSALDAYKKKTKKNLRSHPLLPKLQTCDSPDAVLAVLREQIPVFDQSHNASNTDGRLTRWLNPTVNVLYAFSRAIGSCISLVSMRAFEAYQFKP